MTRARTQTDPPEGGGSVARARGREHPEGTRVRAPANERSASTTNRAWKPAPAKLRRQIQAGDEVDYDALMAWWDEHCPERLRGLAPDTAALLSAVKQLRDGRQPGHLSITYRES